LLLDYGSNVVHDVPPIYTQRVFLPAAAGGGLKVSVGVLPKIGSDFNQNTSPIGKASVWLVFCEGSPADFEAEIDKIFLFVKLEVAFNL